MKNFFKWSEFDILCILRYCGMFLPMASADTTQEWSFRLFVFCDCGLILSATLLQYNNSEKETEITFAIDGGLCSYQFVC